MPAQATYVPIASTTISGNSTSTVTFSNLPQTYTDLVVIKHGTHTGNSNSVMRFNGDTSTNYSQVYNYGNGTNTYVSGSDNNFSGLFIDYINTSGTPPTSMEQVNIMSYRNTAFYTSVIARRDDLMNATLLLVGTWRNTAAITSITIFANDGANFSDGLSINIYGIEAA